MASEKRQAWLGVAAVAILALAVGLYLYRTSGPVGPTDTMTIDGACLACGKDVRASYKAEVRQPAVCPLCGQRAVYAWYYCITCNLRFVPALEPADDGPPRLPMVAACPSCGTSAMGYYAEDPTQQQAKSRPLPKMPK